jgi:hypothetical protein
MGAYKAAVDHGLAEERALEALYCMDLLPLVRHCERGSGAC